MQSPGVFVRFKPDEYAEVQDAVAKQGKDLQSVIRASTRKALGLPPSKNVYSVGRPRKESA